MAKKRNRDRQNGETTIPADSLEAAEDAGLRYVSDDQPGFSRRRNGEEFEYFDTKAKPLQDEQHLLRIKRLAIPPAWSDVWICPSPNGHIQATGRDARGRKQYRYHERWREIRDANKYDRLVDFGKALPKIRRRLKKALALSGLPREKVLATIVQPHFRRSSVTVRSTEGWSSATRQVRSLIPFSTATALPPTGSNALPLMMAPNRGLDKNATSRARPVDEGRADGGA